MAELDYVQWVEPTSLAGGSPSTPDLTPVGIKLVMLHHMEVRIPPGHQGVTGLALVDSGSFVIPYSPHSPAWIIGDDDLLEYDYENELGSNVYLATYNTGTYDHSWQVRLIYTPMSAVDAGDVTVTVPGG